MGQIYERDSQVLGRETEELRAAAVAKANAWTEGQAARLDTSPEVILEAVRRGPWLPEQIEGVAPIHAAMRADAILNWLQGK